MRNLLKEPIQRKIFILTVVFFVTFTGVLVAKSFLHSLTWKSEAAIDNQQSRSILGKVILDKLNSIELNFSRLDSTNDSRDIVVLGRHISSSIADIESVLEVLRNGGHYKNIVPANFDDVDEITEDISFSQDKEGEYVVEVIELTPRILNIKHISVDLIKAVDDSFGVSSEKERLVSEKKIELLLKQSNTFLQRSREDVNRIFYDTNLRIRHLEEEQGKSLYLFTLIRYGILVIVGFISIGISILTIHQIGGIIEKRKEAEEEVAKHRNHLEKLVEERTAELVESRTAALNMMEDAEQARKRAEQSNENLNKEIAERKRIEEALRESEQYLQAIWGIVNTGIVIIDTHTRTIVDVNPAAVELIDLPKEKIIGKICHEFICPAERGKCPITDLGQEVDNSERVLMTSEGREIPILKTVFPIKLKGRDCLLECIVDIGERKQLESQLRQAEKLQSIGELASGIAHEINTPTQYIGDNINFLQESFGEIIQLFKQYERLLAATIKGNVNTELVSDLESAVKDADIEYLIEEIPQAIEHSAQGIRSVAQIVRAMKEFAHPGMREHEKTSIDINHDIENTIMVTRNRWKYVAELKTDFGSDLPPVPCMPGELNQVILNLIVNAADAIAEVAGDESGELGTITISTLLNQDCVEIRVSDTGTGIPEEIQNRIFDPFFTTKEVGKGSGQGLSIAHSVIENKHGGRLTFETETGKGTTFIVSLPVESAMVSGEVENEEAHSVY